MILAVSHFALREYDKFLFYINSIREDADNKHFWLTVYLLAIVKDVSVAEEHYANVSTPSSSFAPVCFTLMDALFLFEKGQKEEAYPMLKEAQANLKMPVLKEIANEYLSQYSFETK